MTKRINLILILTLLAGAWLASVVPAQSYDDGNRDREARERRELENRERRERMERPPREGEFEHRRFEGRDRRPPRREPDFQRPEEFGRMYAWMEVVERMGDMSFNPEIAGMIAIGAIKDDVPREPQARIEDLENLLRKTRTLGLRNAIRMGLKELYLHTEQPGKALDHMRAMLAENDEVLHNEQLRDRERWEQEEYDEDDEHEEEPERR